MIAATKAAPQPQKAGTGAMSPLPTDLFPHPIGTLEPSQIVAPTTNVENENAMSDVMPCLENDENSAFIPNQALVALNLENIDPKMVQELSADEIALHYGILCGLK